MITDLSQGKLKRRNSFKEEQAQLFNSKYKTVPNEMQDTHS